MQDFDYTEKTLHDIVYEQTKISVSKKLRPHLHKFVQLYWQDVKRHGYFLSDVDLHELDRDCRHRIVVAAFKLWTSYESETRKLV